MPKKAPSKTYATHVTTPTGDRVYLRAQTKEELEEKVLEAKIQLRSGVDITQDVPFADYAQTWIKAYKLGKVRPSSYASIETNLRVHVLPFFSSYKLKDVKPMHIQLFITSLSGKSKSLQDKCIRIVKNIFDSAVDNGMIPRSPVSRSDRATAENSPEEEPLTDEQALALLNAVDGTRAYIFCLLALSTGMRRGEILGLMWEDIDFKANVIRVTHNKAFILNKLDAPVTALPKTDAGRRVLPMGSLLKERLLLEKAKSKSPFVVSMLNGKSLTKSAYRALWLNVERRTAGSGSVKVTLDFETHPHQLRHTYITKLFEEGLDLKQVQYLAGHSKPEMTLRVYTHFRQKQRAAETHKQACDAVNYLTKGSNQNENYA